MSTPKQLFAKYSALSNAASFIGSHGEEGFAFKDERLDLEYKKATDEIARQLQSRADKYWSKYVKTGVRIDHDIDEDY